MPHYNKRLQILLSEDQFHFLKDLSERNNRPVADIIREAVEKVHRPSSNYGIIRFLSDRLEEQSATLSINEALEERLTASLADRQITENMQPHRLTIGNSNPALNGILFDSDMMRLVFSNHPLKEKALTLFLDLARTGRDFHTTTLAVYETMQALTAEGGEKGWQRATTFRSNVENSFNEIHALHFENLLRLGSDEQKSFEAGVLARSYHLDLARRKRWLLV